MAYMSPEALVGMGFKRIGKNLKISDKAVFYDVEKIEIGDFSRVDDFCVVSGKVKMGRNVHIAVFCNIAGGSEGITIDDFSGIAYGSQVFSQTDDYGGRFLTGPTIPEKYTSVSRMPIHIKRHCIVGANSVILPGVVLAEGTSIGAMSLVTKSTEDWSIYFGAPAKKIKERDRAMLALEKEYLAEYPGSAALNQDDAGHQF